MMSIVVCEDMPVEAQRLRTLVNAYAQRRGLEVEMRFFEHGEQLLMNFERGENDLAFLDVVMGDGINGLETARQIRKKDADIPIVFVTSFPDFALDSYEVQALHYLVKPITEEGVAAVFERCERLLESSRKTVELVVNRSVEHVLVRDIVYAEVFGNRATVRLCDRTLSTYTPLSQLMEEAGDSLERCHRSYLVNFNHVVRVEGREFVMDTDERIPIRANGRSAVVQSYLAFLARRIRQE